MPLQTLLRLPDAPGQFHEITINDDEEFEQDAEALAQAVIDRMTSQERVDLTTEAQTKGVSETSLVYRVIVVLMERAAAG